MAHAGRKPLDLAFSFDTTGSMTEVIDEVRMNLSEMLDRLCADIPDIRVALIAHGDYGDEYETEIRNFGTSTPDLVHFVKTVEMTGGGDEPECYELVLQQARTHLNWRQNSTRALVIVGDAFPHEVGSKRNKYKIDWKAEVQLLRQMGVTAYCVQCREANNKNTKKFMDHVAEATGGLRLPLTEFRGVRDFLMAIAYRESGAEDLQDVYEREVREREGRAMAGDLGAMLKLMKRPSMMSNASTGKAAGPPADTTEAARPAKARKAAATAIVKRVRKTAASPPVAKATAPKGKTKKTAAKGKGAPASPTSGAWSAWRLVGQPGSRGVSRLSWQPMGSGSVLRSLFGGPAVGQLAVELAVQPGPGARRYPTFGRVLSIGAGGASVANFDSLLSGLPAVRSQLLRVLGQGMRVYARVASAESTGRKLPAGLIDPASYAWNSGRSVRCSGVFVSVTERSLN